MKKRVLAALLCAAMVATSLVGCGETGTDTETQSGSEANPDSTQDSGQEGNTDKVELSATPVLHYTFDSADEGWKVVVADTSKASNNAYDAANCTGSRTIIDGSMDAIQIVDGAVGSCVYLDGTNALDLQITPTNTDEYTVSFWVWASRMTTYGPTLTMGSNMAYADSADNNVTWMNVTQSEWGSSGGAIFPIVWSRNEASNSADGVVCWPWMYSFDDAVHGVKEWCMVTIVCTGEVQDAGPTGVTTVGAKYYINGELTYDSQDNYTNGRYFEYTWDASLAPNIMKVEEGQTFESYFGINYWDVIYKGCVDDLYVFDSAISAEDVKALYQMGDTSVVPNFEEGAAETDYDRPLLTGTGVGANDYTQGWWTTWSDIIEVKEGETKTVTYDNYHTKLYYQTYYTSSVILQSTPTGHHSDPANANYAEGYSEYGVVRMDNAGWGVGYEGIATATHNWPVGADGLIDATQFDPITQEASVVLTVTNNGDTADVVYTVTGSDGNVYTQTYSGIQITGPLYFCITVEKACIDIKSVE